MSTELDTCAPPKSPSRLQLSSPATAALLTGAVTLGAVAFFAAIKIQDRVDVGLLTRDPQVTTESPWYLGAASSIGIVGWSIAAAVLGFAAALLYGAGDRSRPMGAVLSAAVLTSVLLVDDLLLLHDDIFLRVIPDDRPILFSYALVAGAWVLYFASCLPRAAFLPLGVAVAGLALSAGVDVVWISEGDWRLIVEDGSKFLGIWAWAVFALVLSASVLSVGPRPPDVTP